MKTFRAVILNPIAPAKTTGALWFKPDDRGVITIYHWVGGSWVPLYVNVDITQEDYDRMRDAVIAALESEYDTAEEIAEKYVSKAGDTIIGTIFFKNTIEVDKPADFKSIINALGGINANGQHISNLASPIHDTDAATKEYVDRRIATKQDILISGTNIKTVNNTSLLGNGNIAIDSDMAASSDKSSYIKNKVGGYKIYVPNDDITLNFGGRWLDGDSPITKTFDQLLELGCPQSVIDTIKAKKVSVGFYGEGVFLGEAYYDLEEYPEGICFLPTEGDEVEFTYIDIHNTADGEDGGGSYAIIPLPGRYVPSKQDKLVSGTNIKTINNQSILGSGNIEIQGGGGTDNLFIAEYAVTRVSEIIDAYNAGKDIVAKKENGAGGYDFYQLLGYNDSAIQFDFYAIDDSTIKRIYIVDQSGETAEEEWGLGITTNLNKSDIFWATYNATILEQVQSAINSGKLVFVKVDGIALHCPGIISDVAVFTSFVLGYGYISVSLNSNGWQTPVITNPEFQNNKVISIGPASSNIQYPSAKAVYDALITKQDVLVPGTNIKTINGNSILGAGNIVIEPGSEPDNEDIAIDSNNRLKFADRAVAANQKGYVILRKNKTFAEQVTGANTIYEIRDEFDLGAASVTIPTGCVLKFNGGSISNGSLIMQETFLDGDVKILGDVSVSGSVSNDYVTPMMFGAKGDGNTNDTPAFESAVAVCDYIYVPAGDYPVDAGSKSLGYGIRIFRSNVIFAMDKGATLYAQNLPANNPSNQFRCVITVEGPGVVGGAIERISNVTIRGGRIIGGRSNFDLPDSGLTTETILENYCGISARYVDNLCIEDVEITDNTGDAVYSGGCNNVNIVRLVTRRNRRASVSIGLSDGYVIDSLDSLDDCQYVIYENGHYSYATDPKAIICCEPEPKALYPYLQDPIKNVTIRNCKIDVGKAHYAFLGCCVNLIVECNKFVNVKSTSLIVDITGNTTDIHYKVGDAFIRRNMVEISSESTHKTIVRYFVFFNGTENGSFFMDNNIIHGFKAADLTKFVYASISNNFFDYNACVNVKYYSGTRGCDIVGNMGTFSRIVEVINGDAVDGQYLVVKGNVTDGTYARDSTVNSFVHKPQNAAITNVYVVGNRATLTDPFIVALNYLQTDKVILKDNDFNMVGNELYWFDRNGNRRYVNLTMINNHIRTRRQVRQLAGDYGETSVVMKVINNVFSGAETGFTTEEADSAHLKFSNNVYLGQ